MRASSFLRLCPVVAILAFAGCSSTPQERISQNRPLYESFPSDVQQKVSAGQVDVGFTPDMVMLALGKPDRKYLRAEAAGSSEVWVYTKNTPQFSFGFGVGNVNYGGGGNSTSTGVGVSTTTHPDDDEYMRVVFIDGKVTSVEKSVNT
jgi:hypothetical protein